MNVQQQLLDNLGNYETSANAAAEIATKVASLGEAIEKVVVPQREAMLEKNRLVFEKKEKERQRL